MHINYDEAISSAEIDMFTVSDGYECKTRLTQTFDFSASVQTRAHS